MVLFPEKFRSLAGRKRRAFCVWMTLAYVATLLAGSQARAAVENISSNVLEQIRALQTEKEQRTPAQKKMDSQLIYALRLQLGQPIARGVTNLRLLTRTEPDGRHLVDIEANVTPALLDAIAQAGGQVMNSSPRFGEVRARLPLSQIEGIAG